MGTNILDSVFFFLEYKKQGPFICGFDHRDEHACIVDGGAHAVAVEEEQQHQLWKWWLYPTAPSEPSKFQSSNMSI